MAKSGLLTLTEVSKRTGISMPTLQRYKKEYQDRIPSRGEGRKQRYPQSALKVFKQIKSENIKRRGRPARQKSSGDRAKAAVRRGRAGGRKAKRGRKAASSPSSAGLLSLTEVGKRTGISYPTLSRYVKLHGDRIPSEGQGRKRRYHPEAVAVFRELRSQSRRGGGRRKGSGRGKAASGRRTATSSAGSASLARRIQALEKSVRELTQLVKRPIKVTLNR